MWCSRLLKVRWRHGGDNRSRHDSISYTVVMPGPKTTFVIHPMMWGSLLLRPSFNYDAAALGCQDLMCSL